VMLRGRIGSHGPAHDAPNGPPTDICYSVRPCSNVPLTLASSAFSR
jgi:hypothetical protein